MLMFSIWNTNIVLEARAVSRATPISTSRGTTGIVTSQYPSSREAALVTRYRTPLTSAWLSPIKRIPAQ